MSDHGYLTVLVASEDAAKFAEIIGGGDAEKVNQKWRRYTDHEVSDNCYDLLRTAAEAGLTFEGHHFSIGPDIPGAVFACIKGRLVYCQAMDFEMGDTEDKRGYPIIRYTPIGMEFAELQQAAEYYIVKDELGL